jgi:hypothetical protein
MQLPSAADVIALTGTGLSSAVVDALIADAALIAERCLASESGDRQEATLKWLAAHLVASTGTDGVLQSSKLGDASETYMRAATGEALAGTIYGQQAIALTPCLARLGKARASLEVI